MRIAIVSILCAGSAVAKPAPDDQPPLPHENTQLPGSRILQADVAVQCGPPRPGSQVGLLLTAASDAGHVSGYDVTRGMEGNDLYTFLDNGTWEPVLNDKANLISRHANPWKLTRSAYLVEVAINDGRGMPRVVRGDANAFVATKLSIVDRSNRFPIDPVEVLADARRRFDKVIASRAREIRTQLAIARTDTPGKPTGEHEQVWEHFFPTWWEKEQRLEVLYTRVYTRESATQRYSVELGSRMVYDRTGRLIDTKIWAPLPVRPFRQNLILCAYQL